MTNFNDTLLNIIPKNPIQGLAEGNMLQIILFAIIVGIIMKYSLNKINKQNIIETIRNDNI